MGQALQAQGRRQGRPEVPGAEGGGGGVRAAPPSARPCRTPTSAASSAAPPPRCAPTKSTSVRGASSTSWTRSGSPSNCWVSPNSNSNFANAFGACSSTNSRTPARSNSPSSSPCRAWPEASDWVGDPKQSIYRFRQTDPDLITYVAQDIRKATGGADLDLPGTGAAAKVWSNSSTTPSARPSCRTVCHTTRRESRRSNGRTSPARRRPQRLARRARKAAFDLRRGGRGRRTRRARQHRRLEGSRRREGASARPGRHRRPVPIESGLPRRRRRHRAVRVEGRHQARRPLRDAGMPPRPRRVAMVRRPQGRGRAGRNGAPVRERRRGSPRGSRPAWKRTATPGSRPWSRSPRP